MKHIIAKLSVDAVLFCLFTGIVAAMANALYSVIAVAA